MVDLAQTIEEWKDLSSVKVDDQVNFLSWTNKQTKRPGNDRGKLFHIWPEPNVLLLMRFTPAITHSISGLKSRVLKLPFWLKNDGEKRSRIFYFEIHRAPSEITANLPDQFSLSRQMFLHWAAATLKGLGEFQNKKF